MNSRHFKEPVEHLELLNKTNNNRLNGVEGQYFYIQCVAKGGQPPPFLTLKIRNAEVAKEVELDGFILTLKINNFTTNDFTTYTIQLENKVGNPAEYVVTLELSERCKLGKIPDSQAKSENDIHFYQNEECKEPKYEDLRSDCQGNQDLHTTYDSLNCYQSAVVSNDIATKMGGGESKLRINGMSIGKDNLIKA
ncbi:unnamed protein product [Mytilus coruscus]|uniref:Uncharacterized protein n=1 Tax=Mytilus coruscus TaxID=42192 RepID=A0A6J8C213_MYTCO|nr:unnamed protein product [Mytilus coruscus]